MKVDEKVTIATRACDPGQYRDGRVSVVPVDGPDLTPLGMDAMPKPRGSQGPAPRRRLKGG
jgi:hypothetical protein